MSRSSVQNDRRAVMPHASVGCALNRNICRILLGGINGELCVRRADLMSSLFICKEITSFLAVFPASKALTFFPLAPQFSTLL